MSNTGILLIISGPAGSGKGTVIKSVTEQSDDYRYSVSATTRQPRNGEIDGTHYHFITKEEFLDRVSKNDMLEYEQYSDNYYGTPKSNVFDVLKTGRNVILEIEVKGAVNIMNRFPDVVSILILPPDYETLRFRLRERDTESAEEVNKRLKIAKEEIKSFYKYDYVVINENDRAEKAASEIINIINCEKMKTKRNTEFYENFYLKGEEK